MCFMGMMAKQRQVVLWGWENNDGLFCGGDKIMTGSLMGVTK